MARLENHIHLGNNVEVNGGKCHQYFSDYIQPLESGLILEKNEDKLSSKLLF